jgi:hypothetical protein
MGGDFHAAPKTEYAAGQIPETRFAKSASEVRRERVFREYAAQLKQEQGQEHTGMTAKRSAGVSLRGVSAYHACQK